MSVDTIAAVEPLSVTPREAQRLLSISNSSFYKLVREEKLETFLLGRKRLVRYASLKRFAGGTV